METISKITSGILLTNRLHMSICLLVSTLFAFMMICEDVLSAHRGISPFYPSTGHGMDLFLVVLGIALAWIAVFVMVSVVFKSAENNRMPHEIPAFHIGMVIYIISMLVSYTATSLLVTT